MIPWGFLSGRFLDKDSCNLWLSSLKSSLQDQKEEKAKKWSSYPQASDCGENLQTSVFFFPSFPSKLRYGMKETRNLVYEKGKKVLSKSFSPI